MKGFQLLGSLVSLVVLSLVITAASSAHIVHNDGTWTYRYLTRSASSDCSVQNGTGIDPLNVLFRMYGESSRMNDHLNSETHWGFYSSPPGTSIGKEHQFICGDSDANPGNYSVNDNVNFDDQQGHGGLYCTCGVRAHFRIFTSPHSHTDVSEKWSTIDVHHETVVLCGSTVLCHKIDEDWETWEFHIGSEMGGACCGGVHDFYYDYWARQGSQPIQGFTDDGLITRVGGLHNGTYP